MAYDKTRVDSALLSKSISKIEDQLTILQNQFNRLETVMKNLDAGWKGAANRQFMRRYNMDKQIFRTWIKNEKQLNDNLKTAKQEFGKANEEVMRKMRSLPGRR